MSDTSAWTGFWATILGACIALIGSVLAPFVMEKLRCNENEKSEKRRRRRHVAEIAAKYVSAKRSAAMGMINLPLQKDSIGLAGFHERLGIQTIQGDDVAAELVLATQFDAPDIVTDINALIETGGELTRNALEFCEHSQMEPSLFLNDPAGYESRLKKHADTNLKLLNKQSQQFIAINAKLVKN